MGYPNLTQSYNYNVQESTFFSTISCTMDVNEPLSKGLSSK